VDLFKYSTKANRSNRPVKFRDTHDLTQTIDSSGHVSAAFFPVGLDPLSFGRSRPAATRIWWPIQLCGFTFWTTMKNCSGALSIMGDIFHTGRGRVQATITTTTPPPPTTTTVTVTASPCAAWRLLIASSKCLNVDAQKRTKHTLMSHFSLKPFNHKFMRLLCPPKTSRIQLGRSLIDDLRSTIFHWFAKTSWNHTQASLSAAGDRSTRWSAKTN